MPTADAGYMRAYQAAHRERLNRYRTAWMLEARREALLHYGDGSCAECGYKPTDVMALELDHINGDGGDHRRRLGCRGGSAFAVRMRALGWPNDPPLQTLCHDCHVAKTNNEKGERRAHRAARP